MPDAILPGLLLLPLGAVCLLSLAPPALARAPRAALATLRTTLVAACLLALLGILLGGSQGLAWEGWSWLDAPLDSGRRLGLRVGLSGGVAALAAAGASLVLALGMLRSADDLPGATRAALWGASSCLLVLADNAALALIGWVGMGVLTASTLEGAAPGARLRARLSEALILLGVAVLLAAVGTLDFDALAHQAEPLARRRPLGQPALFGLSVAAAFASTLVLACTLRAVDFGAAAWSLVHARSAGGPAWIAALGGLCAGLFLLHRSSAQLVAVPGGVLTPMALLLAALCLGAALSDPRSAPRLAALARAPRRLARIAHGIDREVLVTALPALPLVGARALVWLGRELWSRPRPRRFVTAALVLGLALALLVPHPRMDARTQEQPMELELRGGVGPGYSYLWDLDSDGEADTPWRAERGLSYAFDDAQLARGECFVVLEPGTYGRPLRRWRMRAGERRLLEIRDLGTFWQARGKPPLPPFLEMTQAGLRVRPNGARARRGAEWVPPEQDEVLVKRGESIALGTARLSVTGVARPTLYVRNALGLVRSARGAFELPRIGARPSASVVGGEGGP